MPFFFFDSTMILLVPAFLFTIWAQRKVKTTYSKYAEIPTRSGMSGADVAAAILRDENIELTNNPESAPSGAACGLEVVDGQLTDHYDPRSHTLRLSQDIYYGQSIAALGIAAHEVGHAVQHARMYSPLMMRNIVYPVCGFGQTAAWPLFFIGFIFNSPMLLQAGIVLFTLAVFFTVLTLPVEFNASSRAMRALASGGYLTDEELTGARKVLNAAALTYVAAAAMAIMHLLRMVLLSNSRN
jgi:uncharacterized protein